MLANVEVKFAEFFGACHQQGLTDSEMRAICAPLLKLQQRKRIQRLFLIVAVALIPYFLVTRCEAVSWMLSAIGRLLLIQLLPYWDWTALYNTKCLVESSAESVGRAPKPPLGRYETDEENCVMCENLDRIATLRNVNFSYIESSFLERGLPAIITDSHQIASTEEMLEAIEAAGSAYLDAQPCDVATNLMLRKLFNLNSAMQKILLASSGTDTWFLQWRNCEFAAVKQSRLFLPRPYYYPVHLKPFYSSWLLMAARNYSKRYELLYMQGLIVVQQLQGLFDIELRPKRPCGSCPVVAISLRAGESLVFATDLWSLSYGLRTRGEGNHQNNSLAVILEIDWTI